MDGKNGDMRAAFGGWIVLPILGLLLATSVIAVEPAKCEEDKSVLEEPGCELVLGEHLEYLSLTDRQGSPVAYRSRGTSMFVPPGQYLIEDIHFKGGYSVAPCYGQQAEQLTLAPGKTSRLDIGATLTPSVAVKRAGRVLKLDYQILDGNGRKYRRNDSGRITLPPHFVIYQGDREIGSGDFEYG